ncbi:MAG: hypothetical protein BHV98_04360 [Clostridium sp. CAG:217_53_7]|nr:MAG: hypothetical protein BHV98_04360 [Clostridium sp. CAG:217_53_7]
MDAINLILFAVLFVLQVAILILLLRRRSGDAGHQTELLARQLQAQDNERRAQIERLEAAVQTLREDNYRQQVKLLELVQNQSDSQTRRVPLWPRCKRAMSKSWTKCVKRWTKN